MFQESFFVDVEEKLNNRTLGERGKRLASLVPGTSGKRIADAVRRRVLQAQETDTLYDTILFFIRRLNRPKYFRKNGALNEAAFYRDAQIDKTTWSDLRWGKVIPNKKTLLKLVIALELNEEEADDLMKKGSNSLNPTDPRDLVILALLDVHCYDPFIVYEVLEEYGKNGIRKFENIYEDPAQKSG